MNHHTLRHQPDDPGHHPSVCPTCNRPWPDDDADVEKFLRLNAGNFTPAHLARILSWSLHRLERYAAKASPPIDLTLKKEPEPRGA